MAAQPAIWINGTRATALPLPNRGVDFGDGVFETLLVRLGNPLFVELHMERLQRGMQVLGIPNSLGVSMHQLEAAANSIAQAGWEWAALRLSVIRGSGDRGYTPANNAEPLIVIHATQLDRDCERMSSPAKLAVATIRLSSQPILAGIKHLNRLEQVLAASQAAADDVEECVMLDQSEHLTSVIAGNLFLVRQDELLTPALLDCGIAGTRRKLIIDTWAPALGLKVREERLTMGDLYEADEIFYSNSLQTVRPVASVNTHSWSSHGICNALFKQYLDELL